MLNKNTLTFLECDKDFSGARTVLFGAPFDSTTSFRPGTRFGPHAVRSESFGLESYSPYLDRDLIDAAVLAKDYAAAKRFGAAQCIACGCCSYVCPAERYLTQSVRLGRKIVKERKL